LLSFGLGLVLNIYEIKILFLYDVHIHLLYVEARKNITRLLRLT